jgi:DNA-binding IclR family transcriptional regulator
VERVVPKHRYVVRSVVHSVLVLSVFQSDGEALTLSTVARRSRLQRSTTYRLLYTLQRCGFVERVAKNLYRRRGVRVAGRLSTHELKELAS